MFFFLRFSRGVDLGRGHRHRPRTTASAAERWPIEVAHLTDVEGNLRYKPCGGEVHVASRRYRQVGWGVDDLEKVALLHLYL